MKLRKVLALTLAAVMTMSLVACGGSTETTEAPTNPLLETLTKREKEVLELIGQGYANSDIAKILVISDHTVNDYTKKIYKKLNVHSRHAAAKIINTSK